MPSQTYVYPAAHINRTYEMLHMSSQPIVLYPHCIYVSPNPQFLQIYSQPNSYNSTLRLYTQTALFHVTTVLGCILVSSENVLKAALKSSKS